MENLPCHCKFCQADATVMSPTLFLKFCFQTYVPCTMLNEKICASRRDVWNNGADEGPPLQLRYVKTFRGWLPKLHVRFFDGKWETPSNRSNTNKLNIWEGVDRMTIGSIQGAVPRIDIRYTQIVTRQMWMAAKWKISCQLFYSPFTSTFDAGY